ncbi:MAG: kelch repeat-containing protein [Candidatus Acidiferrales bacterium]
MRGTNWLERLSGFVLAGLFLLALTVVSGSATAQTSGTWSTTGSLNIERTRPTATLLANGEVLVVGGEDSAGVLTSAEVYNPSTGMWSTAGTLATPRLNHTATLLPNGQVLVAGGNPGTGYTASAELYNPSTGKWSMTGSMTVPRAFAGAALLANGEVLVAGGSNLDGTSGNSSELYNPSTGKWTATGAMPIANSAPTALLQNGLVLVAGGDYGEVYNPATGTWTATSRLYYTGATGVSIAALNNGDALLFGNHLPSYTGQFYSPATNTWSRTTSQPGSDFGPLVALTNGEVLLAGGGTVYSGKSTPTTRAALYNPATNTWTITGGLKVASNPAAVRLQNGKVLAVGATDVEIYTPGP